MIHLEILVEDHSGKIALEEILAKIGVQFTYKVISYKSFASDPDGYIRYVFVVCDLDERDEAAFRAEIQAVVDASDPAPRNLICFAIEEGEAWLLGDREAVVQAYPKANKVALANYVQDSVCGTWEKLADAIYPGGAKTLKKQHFSEIGRQKSIWAQNIAPLVETARNESPSFQVFIEALKLTTEQS